MNCPSMTLPDGYTDLPPGKIASVVTYLEMRDRPLNQPFPAPGGLSIRKVPDPDLGWYRELYRAVGQEWLWFSRLRMSDDELARTLHDPNVELYALSFERRDQGLLELDRRATQDRTTLEVEISSFGLTQDSMGRGAGRYLMAQALESAWARSPQRVWLHTCTLDHPRALPFYLKMGFIPYKRAIEISDDPRLTGYVPRSAASHVPLIGE
jgi:GNAT superfamily N-acetyltransferase